MSNFGTIASSAVLIAFNAGNWTARKADKKTAGEVAVTKNAHSSRAVGVSKNLLVDNGELKAITAYAADTRNWLKAKTLAWDSGRRLLPTPLIPDVVAELERRIDNYWCLVDKFIAVYAVRVSSVAFQLGDLFDRSEYPSEAKVRSKFHISYEISPVPTAGDFRIDVQNAGMEMLKEQFERTAERRVTEALREPWERAFRALSHTVERLTEAANYTLQPGEDPRKAPRLFESMIDNFGEVANSLDALNITNDPALRDCAARMRAVYANVDIKSLRETKELKEAVISRTQEVMKSFDFSAFAEFAEEDSEEERMAA